MKAHSARLGSFKIIVCGGAVFASAIAGAFVFARGTGASKPASDPYKTATIQLAPQGSTCRRLLIDNKTGTIQSSQQINCGEPPKGSPPGSVEAGPSQYSAGGRIDSVRNGFRNR